MSKALKVKVSQSDKVFDIVNYAILFIVFLSVVLPLYFIVIASISSPDAIYSGEVRFIPKDISLEGYRKIFGDKNIWLGYKNSLIYTTLGTIISVIVTMAAAYPLSRKSFTGRNVFMVFFIITMYFNGGLIPTYLVVKDLGLLNKWPVMVIVGMVSVWNLIIARTFFQHSIPDELYEAASIDGCGQLTFFVQVVMPLSKAIAAVLALYYGVGQWNEFFRALIYLSDEALYPLQLVLRSILIMNQNSDNMVGDVISMMERQKQAELIKYGVIIVASLPVLILYPFLQKYFVKGVMIGSLKG